MSGYINTFKDKGGDKNKNNKLISLSIDDDKLFEKCTTIWILYQFLMIDI